MNMLVFFQTLWSVKIMKNDMCDYFLSLFVCFAAEENTEKMDTTPPAEDKKGKKKKLYNLFFFNISHTAINNL